MHYQCLEVYCTSSRHLNPSYRCSLTRLGFDKEWEDDRWKKSWERVEAKVDDESLCLIESQDAKGPGEVKMTGFQEVEAGGWCQGVGGKSGSLPSTA